MVSKCNPKLVTIQYHIPFPTWNVKLSYFGIIKLFHTLKEEEREVLHPLMDAVGNQAKSVQFGPRCEISHCLEGTMQNSVEK